MEFIGYKYQKVNKNLFCSGCGKEIIANHDYVIHGSIINQTEEQFTLCTFCISNMNKMIEDFHKDRKENNNE